jgi:hypothetical protein
VSRHLSLLLCCSICAGCAAGYNPRYQLNEIVILNSSDQALTDVAIRANGRVFGCDNVAPRGICSERFPRRSYQPDTVEIEWTMGNGPRQSESLAARVPANFITGLALRGVLEVGPQDEIDSYLEQETPFR